MIAGCSRAALGAAILGVLLGAGFATTAWSLHVSVGLPNDPQCTFNDLSAALAAVAASGPDSDTITIKWDYSEALDGPLTVDLEVSGDLRINAGIDSCDMPTSYGPLTTLEFASGRGLVVLGGLAATRELRLDKLHLRPAPGSAGVGRMLDLSRMVQAYVDRSEIEGGTEAEGGAVRLSGSSVEVTFYGFRLPYNQVHGGIATGDGGGILVDGAHLVLESTDVYQNQAAGHGGGIASRNGGSVVLNGSSLFENQAGGRGGGIDCRSGGSVVLNSSSVRGNQAGDGGGLSSDGCPVEVGPYAVLAQNVAVEPGGGGGAILAEGGAVVNLIGPSTVDLGVLDPMIGGNQADSGGGILVRGAGTILTLADTDVVGNSASTQGGGLAIDAGAEAALFRTRIRENTGPAGSAAWVAGPGSTLLLESDLLGANGGGPVLQVEGGALLTVGLVTAVANDLAGGAALAASGTGSTIEVGASALLDGRVFAPPAAGVSQWADCVVALDLTDFPVEPRPGSYLQAASSGEVLFQTNGTSATLRQDSPAIDFCDGSAYLPTGPDIDGESRVYDHPPAGSSRFGILDLGADESRSVFSANHETGDCSEWSFSTGCS